jgi:hypothetical protein
MTAMRTRAHLLVLATLLAGCGGPQQPRQDSIEQRWKGLLAQCKVDPLVCKRRCDGGDSVACSVLTNESVAAKLKEKQQAGDDGADDGATVIEILAVRQPARPPATTTRPVPALLTEISATEDLLKKAPKLALKLASLYTELALFSGPAEPDAKKRPKLIRAGATKALTHWSTAIKGGFVPEDDKSLYTMALLYEVLDQRDQARASFMKIVGGKSPLVPHALFGLAVLFERDGKGDYAKKTFMKAIEIPPWDNPLWDLARQRAGLPEGYETPAMIARREAAERAAAEAKKEFAFGLVSGVINDVAQLRFQVKVAKTVGPSKPNLKAVPVVEAEAARKVKEDFCPAKQRFIDEYGPDEFAARAKAFCVDTPPVGTAGGSVNLTADCQAIVATACAMTPSKDAPFLKKKTEPPKPAASCVPCTYNTKCQRLQNKPGDCCEPIAESVDGSEGAARCREVEAKMKKAP